MKFVELKNNLKMSIDNVYVVFGDDLFLQNNALQLIENALCLSMPDVNKIIYSESNTKFDSVLDSALASPFFDEKRLLIFDDYNSLDVKKDVDKLKKYVDQIKYNVFVFKFSNVTDFCKKLNSSFCAVDCSKLDDSNLRAWILNNLKKSSIGITENGISKLIRYCSNDLTKISIELNKLKSIGVSIIDESNIEEFVVPTQDYQIYELTEKLAVGDKQKVFDIINTLFYKDKNPVGLIQYIYNSFRRLLYIGLSQQKSDNELSVFLNVKPYAIKMARGQAKKFSIKQLKRINAELSSLELGIKSGKINQDIAVSYSICNILLMR